MGLIDRLEGLAGMQSLGLDTRRYCRDAALTFRRFVQAFAEAGRPDRNAYTEFYKAMVWAGLTTLATPPPNDVKSAVAAIALARRGPGVLDINEAYDIFREVAGFYPTYGDVAAMRTLGLLNGRFQPRPRSERELSLADEQVQTPPVPKPSGTIYDRLEPDIYPHPHDTNRDHRIDAQMSSAVSLKRAADASEKIHAALDRIAAGIAAAAAKDQPPLSVSSWFAGREPGGMAATRVANYEHPPYTPVADICGWDLGAGMWARCARCRAELDLAERPPQCVDRHHPSELTEGLQE